jgi:hypothetical protein
MINFQQVQLNNIFQSQRDGFLVYSFDYPESNQN